MEINKPTSIVIILLITVTIFSLFVIPKYQESLDLEKDLAKKQYQYEKRVDYYLRLSDILQDIEQRGDVLEKVESALPSELKLAPIIYFLQQKAEQSELTATSILFSKLKSYQQVSPEGASKEIKNIVFRIELSGSYQGLKNFLASIENSARLFEVSSIAFASEQPSGTSKPKSVSQTHNFTLEIQTHLY